MSCKMPCYQRTVPGKGMNDDKCDLADPVQMAMLALPNLPFHILPCSAAQNETNEAEE